VAHSLRYEFDLIPAVYGLELDVRCEHLLPDSLPDVASPVIKPQVRLRIERRSIKKTYPRFSNLFQFIFKGDIIQRILIGLDLIRSIS